MHTVLNANWSGGLIIEEERGDVPEEMHIGLVPFGDSNKERFVILILRNLFADDRRWKLFRILVRQHHRDSRLKLLTSNHDASPTSVLERDQTTHFDSLRSFVDNDSLESIRRQTLMARSRQCRTDNIGVAKNLISCRSSCSV